MLAGGASMYDNRIVNYILCAGAVKQLVLVNRFRLLILNIFSVLVTNIFGMLVTNIFSTVNGLLK